MSLMQYIRPPVKIIPETNRGRHTTRVTRSPGLQWSKVSIVKS